MRGLAIQRAQTDPTTALQIEVSKKIVDVQQHFNDLELRIRNLMVTILGAILGAAGFALKDQLTINISEQKIGLEIFLMMVALVVVGGFWFMDRHWYHRLLVGAVKQGLEIEQRLEGKVPGVSLTKTIGEESPVVLFGKRFRSADKIDIFYGVFFFPSATLFAFAIDPVWGGVACLGIFAFTSQWVISRPAATRSQ